MKKIKSSVLRRSFKDLPTVQKPKILCVDIETAPAIAAVWQKWQTDTVWTVSDWYMLSWSVKWVDGKQVTKALCDYKGYVPGSEDDKALVTELWELLDNCDVAVAHNGNSFDFPKCRARFLKHGLPPPAPFIQVDTCRLAKSTFGFFSNKLDDIGKYLGLGQKVQTGGYRLWQDCMAGDKKAWGRMKKYNAMDTSLLEAVYLKLRPWTRQPNMGVLTGQEDVCPKCGGTELVRRGFAISSVGRAVRYRCKGCGGYSQSRPTKVTDIR